MVKEIICKNCGKKGHIFSNCTKPIISCGVILYMIDKGTILMVQRKDSYCYIDIIRGKYNLNNIEYIQKLLSRITTNELQKLLNNDYDFLWNDLWYSNLDNRDKYTKSKSISKEYNYSKNKFNKLKNGFIVHNKLVNLQIISTNIKTYQTPEWEFPKGRRNYNETNKECGIRELIEETNIKYTDFSLIDNIAPYYEEIISENNKHYKNILFIGVCNNSNNISIKKDNLDQINEISNVLMLNKEEALLKVRDYNITKKNIIHKIFNLFNNDKIQFNN